MHMLLYDTTAMCYMAPLFCIQRLVLILYATYAVVAVSIGLNADQTYFVSVMRFDCNCSVVSEDVSRRVDRAWGKGHADSMAVR